MAHNRHPKGVSILRRGRFWRVQIRRKGLPSYSGTYDSEQEAKEASQRVLRDLEDGVPRSSATDSMTLAEALLRWADEAAPMKRAAATRERADDFARRLAREPVARRRFRDVTPAHLLDFRREKEKAGYSANTVRLWFATISQVYNFSTLYWGMRVINPVVRGINPQCKGRERRLVDDEEAKLLAACRTPQDRALVIIGIDAGLRSGEAGSLRPVHVLDNHQVPVLRVEAGTNDFERLVPITPRLQAALRDVPANPRGLLLGMVGLEISKAFTAIRKRAGIENLKFHDLRHEAISRWAERRPPLSDGELMMLGGHKTAAMLARYRHLRPVHHLDHFTCDWVVATQSVAALQPPDASALAALQSA